jgi:acetyl esterase/lipase
MEARVALSTAAATPAPTYGVRSIQNVVYTHDGGQAEHLDLYLPRGPVPPGGRPAVLALPGGGWRWVRRSDLGQSVSGLAKYGYVVAVADYTYAGTNPGSKVWPKNFEDVRNAVIWLRQNAGRFGIDPNRIAAWGESAGGHLANLLGTDPQGPAGTPPSNGPSPARVGAVVDFYGPTDLPALYQQSAQDRSFLVTFLGTTPDKDPASYRDASPIHHVSPGDPPFLIFQGSTDKANPLPQSLSFAQALRRAGVPTQVVVLPGVPHGFRLKLDHGKVNLLPQIVAFLNASLGGPKGPGATAAHASA